MRGLMLSALKKQFFSSSPKLLTDKVDDRAMLICPDRIYDVRRRQQNAEREHGDDYFGIGIRLHFT